MDLLQFRLEYLRVFAFEVGYLFDTE